MSPAPDWYAVVSDTLHRIEDRVNELDAKLSDALSVQARHDEQLRALTSQRTWGAGLIAALLLAYAKDKLGWR